jgi:hypothetical protein
MKQKSLLKTMLLLFALIAGSSSVWADTYTTTFSRQSSKLKCTGDITYTTTVEPSGNGDDRGPQFGTSGTAAGEFTLTAGTSVDNITSVVVACCTASKGSATVQVKVGGSALGTTQTIQPNTSSADNYTFNGSTLSGIVTIHVNASSKAFYLKSVTITYTSGGGGSDPSISANNVNIAQDATNGSIAYTLNNATGNVSASITTGDWLTLGTITSSTVPFTCSANTGAQRTATVTLSFTGATDKVVTITQDAKTVTAPTFNPEGGSYMQGTGITLTSEGNTIYYNIKTDGTTPSDPTNASTEYTAPIVLGSGTTKIKAIAYDTYGNASSVVTRTYTGIALASLPFSWTGTSSAGKDDLAAQTGVALSLGSDYATSNAPYRLKFDGTSKYVIIYTDEKPENVYFTAKLFNAASTGSKIKVQGSADGITFTDIEEFTIKGAANATFEFSTSNAFATTHRAVKLVMSSKDQNVAVGTICVSCIPITPAKTYTTLTSAYALDFTGVSGLKAYIATEVSEGNVLMTQVNKVPANTGLVLKATTPGSAVNVPVFDGTGADDVSANKMAGSATETTAIAANAGYILKDGVFHPASAGTLAAGKAYLNIAVSAGASALNLDFGGEVTGVNEVREVSEVNDNSWYNLAGQRVAQPTKGLYIVNGKKVIIK